MLQMIGRGTFCLDGDLDLGGKVGGTAGVLAHLEVDEAIVTPCGVPAVADNPVRDVGVGVVANELDSVVHLAPGVAAAVTGHDTAGVARPLASIDSNADRAEALKVGLQSVLVLVVAGTDKVVAGRGSIAPAVNLATTDGEFLARA